MTEAKKTTLPRLTMPDLVKVFRVSHITIINWKSPKEGVEHRKTPLPHFKAEDGRVTYNARAVKAWAEKHDVAMHADPIGLAERLAAKQAKASAPKPGPKPRNAAKKAPAKKVDVVARAKKEKARDEERIESKRTARANAAKPTPKPAEIDAKPARKHRAKPKEVDVAPVKTANGEPTQTSEEKPKARARSQQVQGVAADSGAAQ